MTFPGRLTMLIAVAVALLVAAGAAHAKQTPEQKCQKARYDAAAKYTSCQQKLQAMFLWGTLKDFGKFQTALSKCRVKYTDTWVKLQRKAGGTGASCDRARFEDNHDGTVTDWLTGLQWEQKTDDATVHDKDNVYTWTAGVAAADGTAFTSFLSQLNFPFGCFAGQCDWRLPTPDELQTILSQPYPCAPRPCIDETVFGPTASASYWSATTYASSPGGAWCVLFGYGNVFYNFKTDFNTVRAVRAGL